MLSFARLVVLLGLTSQATGLQLRPCIAMKRAGAAATSSDFFAGTTVQQVATTAPRSNNVRMDLRPDEPWSKAQGAALYAFVYALIGALILYRQANPVGGVPGLE